MSRDGGIEVSSVSEGSLIEVYRQEKGGNKKERRISRKVRSTADDPESPRIVSPRLAADRRGSAQSATRPVEQASAGDNVSSSYQRKLIPESYPKPKSTKSRSNLAGSRHYDGNSNDLPSISDMPLGLDEMPEVTRAISTESLESGSCHSLNGREETLEGLQSEFFKPLRASKIRQRAFDRESLMREFKELQRIDANRRADRRYITYYSCSVALMPVNTVKNRYRDVLPYNRTRVQLTFQNGSPFSDYINASYLYGVGGRSNPLYICAQGPLKNTAEDFWRMVIESEACVVLMLTPHLEGGQEKVYRYHPPMRLGQAEHLGLYKLIVHDVEFDDETNVQASRIIVQSAKESRTILHLSYFAWPDHGVPNETGPVVQMMHRTDEEMRLRSRRSVPIVVHCSAGIGRTGTFCLAHMALRYFEGRYRRGKDVGHQARISLFSELLRMRDDRAGLIQNAEQYIFAYRLFASGLKSYRS